MMARQPARVPPPPLTAAEAARQLGVYRQRVYELIRSGRIAYLDIPGVGIRIEQDEIDRFKKACRVPASAS